MSAQTFEFNRGAIRPVECVSEAWQLVKREYWLMVGICAAGMLVGSVAPLGILLGPLMCGVHMCVFALMRGEKPSFNLLFKGFDFFVPSLIATLVQVVPVLALLVPAYVVFFVFLVVGGAAAGGGGDAAPPIFAGVVFAAFAVFVLFVMAVGIAVGTFFTFAYPLVAERGLSGFDACKLSARAVLGNLGGALGLMVLNALMGVAGALVCYVGVFLVLPISFAAVDVAYRRVFPDGPRDPSPYTPPPQYPNYGAHYPPAQ